MFYRLTVLLHLYNGLSKVLGLNTFNLQENKQQFCEWRFGWIYAWIWHWLFVCPACVFGCLEMYRQWMKCAIDLRILTNIIIYVFRYCGAAVSSWNLLRNQRSLCELLNLFICIGRMHLKLFGMPVKVKLKKLVIHWIREIFVWICFCPVMKWSLAWLQVYFARCTMLDCLVDLATFLHFHFVLSLSLRLDNCVERSKREQTLYVEYYKKLVKLRVNMQKLCWAAYLTRLIISVLYITQCGYQLYWHKDFRSIVHLAGFNLLLANIWPILKLIRLIEGMERKIFEQLYNYELLKSLRLWKRSRNSRLLKLDLIQLKRCTLQERVITVYNCISVRRTLVLDMIDFVFVKSLLIISFSIKYSTIDLQIFNSNK